MNLKLKRIWYRADGIISNVFDAGGAHIMTTLEHAYPDGAGQWEPKVPPGVYECQRGMHQLAHGPAFETFEVMGVRGHSGILWHHGNWNEDSEGCILTGLAVLTAPNPHEFGHICDLVSRTDEAFAAFMKSQEGLSSFTLTVEA